MWQANLQGSMGQNFEETEVTFEQQKVEAVVALSINILWLHHGSCG
jgi:hypothetical protein